MRGKQHIFNLTQGVIHGLKHVFTFLTMLKPDLFHYLFGHL